jgi:hypothetical protein
MNQKQIVQSDWTPPYLHEVKVNGYRLLKGMEATLAPERGRKEKRRYEFRYGEIVKSRAVHFTGGGRNPLDFTGIEYGPVEEVLMLTFYGPVRSTRQKMRTVRAVDVLTVHVKSEAR